MTIRYTAAPYICGALGLWDAAALTRLVEASPAGLHRVHLSPAAVLYASSTPESWSDGPRSGLLWSARGQTLPRPTSWREAAETRLAAGLETEGSTATLHTDALGLAEVYVRELGNAVYFSGRIDPLTAIDDQPLHTDWATWANIFVTLTPMGDQTPFAEIKRLEGGTALRSGGERVTFQPSWQLAEPERLDPEDVADLIAEQIPAQDLTVALSGGWDSRLLAALAMRRGPSQVAALTTSNDDGMDHDIRCAELVATELKLPHRVIVPGAEAWLDDHEEVWSRVQHQTSHHTWQMPLARVARVLGGPLLDGLGGDALFRNRAYYRDVESATPDRARHITWSALTGGRLDHKKLFAPGILEKLERLSRESFDRVMSPLDGHHALPVASRLLRTCRSIGSSPHWILGPETDVVVPFISPATIGAAFRLTPDLRQDNDFHRAMLAHADKRLAQLPSTHDDLGGVLSSVPRKRSTAALASVAAEIDRSDQVRALLGPTLLGAVADPWARAKQSQWQVPLTALHWAGMFAHWRRTYASRLSQDDLP